MPLSKIDFEKLSLPNRIKAIRSNLSGKIVFTTSLGIEDQLITHHIASQKLAIEIVTLDTGRLFDESHELWQKTEDSYGIAINGYYPDHNETAKWVRINGTNGFKNSVEARKACCAIRKVEPLNRALAGADGWMTGLRSDQSQLRNNVGPYEIDDERNLIKLSPLFDYTREQVVDEVKTFGVPYNPLHDKGFLSIGCAPCTRAVANNEPERAGRWWWESDQLGQKECGLHIDAQGKLVRKKEPV
jgi:phosphoadenosine phosphosulfate reductase